MEAEAGALPSQGAGREDARAEFGRLVEAHWRSAYRFAYRLTGNPEEAADLVQQAAEEAFRAFSGFRPGTRFDRWWLRILYNSFVDRTRRPGGSRTAEAPPGPAGLTGVAAGLRGRLETRRAAAKPPDPDPQLLPRLLRVSPGARRTRLHVTRWLAVTAASAVLTVASARVSHLPPGSGGVMEELREHARLATCTPLNDLGLASFLSAFLPDPVEDNP